MFSKSETLKLKGIAILLLLFHHMFYNLERVSSSGIQFFVFSRNAVQQAAVAARICVWIFAFLSAYGLTCQYMKKKEESKIQFIIRRWISLMKSYWCIYLLVFIMYWCMVDDTINFYQNNPVKILLDAMGLSDFFGSPILLGVWWYMCFAQLLVISIPFVNCLCEKLGWSSYILTFIVLQYLPDGIKSANGGRYSNYFLVVILAVLCARNGTLNSILNKKGNKLVEAFKCGIVFFLIISLLLVKLRLTDIDQWQVNSFISSVVTLLICYFISSFFNYKTLTAILTLLGRHSANIFMIHAFFYTFVPEYIYWSNSAVISYIILLLVSLVFSAAIEFIKKITCYNVLFQKISNYIVEKCYVREE